MRVKLILKGVLLWVTAFAVILFISGVDSLYNNGYFIYSIVICAVLCYACYNLISEKELKEITLYKWFNKLTAKNMRFVIVDAGQYAYGNNKISPEYIDKLKDKYKLETVKVNRYNKEVECTIVTINNIVSLVELQKLVGKFVIGLDLYLPEEIESIADSTIVIYDDYIE